MSKKPEKNFDYLWSLRHSCEHVLTQAMQELYPKKFTMAMGPATDEGFYFDFETLGDFKVSSELFPEIEAKMEEIIKKNLPITKEVISPAAAQKLFAKNVYKQEWITQFSQDNQELSVYKTGDEFVDLCAGPHVESTGKIGAFKLLSVAGAYWHGDEKNKMLTRIYGTAFQTQSELEEYLYLLEEAKKRDHRKLGKELDLFFFSELVGKMPIYTQKGYIILEEMRQYSSYLNHKIGYQEVWTPQINRAELFKVSGHYDTYKQDMMQVKSQYEKEEYFLKPMNCPQHTQIYANRMRSYKDLPIRIADFANLYRDERPGTLNGLLRLRYFRQDDGHSFCRPDQIQSEIENIVSIVKEALTTYGIADFYVRLSLRDPDKKSDYIGDDEIWEKSEKLLTKIAENLGLNYVTKVGEAAIYGPKLDFMAKDVLQREWQVSTIQLDFNQPTRFQLKYTDSDGQEKTPVMIHRAITGGLERFFGLLIEQYTGAFPVWLSPIQVSLIPITEKQNEYAESVAQKLTKAGIRLEIQNDTSTMQAKIKQAQDQKIPYMLILGGKEQEANAISIRTRNGKQLNGQNLADFITHLQQQIQEKSLNLIQ